MSKLKIFTFPDIVLAQKAQPIARVEKTLYKVADDMLETMYDAPGIGLAANQVGILQRFVVIDTDYELEEDTGIVQNRKPLILFNPEIIHKEGGIVFNEGCLSVPEYTAEVKRAEKIKVQYQDVDGVTRILDAEGLLAIAVQHELDHLDGKLFIDRLSPLKKEMVRKRLKQDRILREAEAEMNGGFDPTKPKKKTKGF